MCQDIHATTPRGISLLGLLGDNHRSETADEPRRVAKQFLEALAQGSFRPESLDLGQQVGPVLSLGQEWDNQFLALRHVEIDNRVVQAVQSRMARYRTRAMGKLELSQLGFGSATEASEPDSSAWITFEILWDGARDGTITLRRSDYRIWGPSYGWRVWELTP
jgi:hypothetical protein